MNSLKSTALSPVRNWDEMFQIRATTNTRTIQNSRLRVVEFTSYPPTGLTFKTSTLAAPRVTRKSSLTPCPTTQTMRSWASSTSW